MRKIALFVVASIAFISPASATAQLEHTVAINYLGVVPTDEEATMVEHVLTFCKGMVKNLKVEEEQREIYFTCLRYHLPRERYQVADTTDVTSLREFFGVRQDNRPNLRIEFPHEGQ